MNKKPYAWLDGIPDTTTDLYNDAGFLNESEVEEKVDEGIDLDSATNGQLLSCAVVGNVKSVDWVDPPSGGTNYSTSEQDTGTTWVNGETVYQKTYVYTGTVYTTNIIDSDFTSTLYKPIEISGMYNAAGGWFPLNQATTAGYGQDANVQIDTSGAFFRINLNSSVSGTYHITIKYIKNT